MTTKFGQKTALISSLHEIGKFIACTVGISGLVNFNTLSEFLREPRELPRQPNLNKNKANCTDFGCLQEIEDFFCMKSQDFESANSNMLSQFSREPRELPRQPNLKKKNKIALISVLCKKSRNFSHEKSGFWVDDFKYAITREFLWQPNSEKYKPTLQKFLFLAKNRGIYHMFCRFYGLHEFKYAT